jgi:hypothetical protein
MTKPTHLLEKHTLADVFLVVYVLVDDYLKAGICAGRFVLPESKQQKGSYAELMTIGIVGDWMKQRYAGDWYVLVKQEYDDLFPQLPDSTRYYRILKNLERIFADMALVIGMQGSGMLILDSMPLPICKGVRWKRLRAMTEAASGRYSLGKMYGFKLHGVVNQSGMFSRFAIVPANEHDVTVAKALLADSLDLNYLGDKGYVGSVVYTPPKENTLNPWPWPNLLGRARKLIETVYCSLNRTKNITLGQLNSFWSIRAKVCRKIAAHNLAIFLFGAMNP